MRPGEKGERPLRGMPSRRIIFVEQHLTSGELLGCRGFATAAGTLHEHNGE